MNVQEAIVSLNSHTGFFRHWMSRNQRTTLTSTLYGEESELFVAMLTDLKERIEAMPKSHETDGQGDNAVVHLHYFKGAVDAWITERDMGDDGPTPWLNTEIGPQIQAYGSVSLGYGAETGYVSIQELIEAGVELDLYWTPKKLKDCK